MGHARAEHGQANLTKQLSPAQTRPALHCTALHLSQTKPSRPAHQATLQSEPGGAYHLSARWTSPPSLHRIVPHLRTPHVLSTTTTTTTNNNLAWPGLFFPDLP